MNCKHNFIWLASFQNLLFLRSLKNSILKKYLVFILTLCSTVIFSQKKPATYDVVLAKSFNADDNGMKKYVFCIFLKTGNNINATKAEKNKAFEGHMANINDWL